MLVAGCKHTFLSGDWREGRGAPRSPLYHTCLSIPSSERWSSVQARSVSSASSAMEDVRTAAEAGGNA